METPPAKLIMVMGRVHPHLSPPTLNSPPSFFLVEISMNKCTEFSTRVANLGTLPITSFYVVRGKRKNSSAAETIPILINCLKFVDPWRKHCSNLFRNGNFFLKIKKSKKLRFLLQLSNLHTRMKRFFNKNLYFGRPCPLRTTSRTDQASGGPANLKLKAIGLGLGYVIGVGLPYPKRIGSRLTLQWFSG